jgi:hypothetical protein
MIGRDPRCCMRLSERVLQKRVENVWSNASDDFWLVRSEAVKALSKILGKDSILDPDV